MFAGGFGTENGRDFFGKFYVVPVSWEIEDKKSSKHRGKFGGNFGTKIQKIRGTFVLQLNSDMSNSIQFGSTSGPFRSNSARVGWLPAGLGVLAGVCVGSGRGGSVREKNSTTGRPEIRADFQEGDEDSNFSVFRVRWFSEWPEPLH